MALDALDLKPNPDETQRCELLLALGDAARRSGNWSVATETFLKAAQQARELGIAERLARAALGYAHSVMGVLDLRTREIDLLEEGVAAFGDRDSPIHSMVLARLGSARYASGSPGLGKTLCRRAGEMAQRLGDKAAVAYALDRQHDMLFEPENVEERLSIANRVAELARQCGDGELQVRAHDRRSAALLELGDVQAAKLAAETCTKIAGELRQPAHLHWVLQFRVMWSLLEGRFAEAERLAQQSRTFGRYVRPLAARQVFAMQMFVLRRELRRLDDRDLAAGQRWLQENPEVPGWRAGIACVYSDLDRNVEARQQFEMMADQAATLPRSVSWLFFIALACELCATLGDRSRAGKLYDLISPYGRRAILAGATTICLGSAHRYLGLLATTMRHWEDAERHFDDALAMNARMGARPYVAWTQHDYAKMLLTRRGPGDRKKAYALLKEALEAAREMGMMSLEERAQKLLESRKGLVPSYPDGLTRREVEVLRLIAAGKSSGEIADQLFLSPRTVERHITNAYGKINAHSRVEAAAYAQEHALK